MGSNDGFNVNPPAPPSVRMQARELNEALRLLQRVYDSPQLPRGDPTLVHDIGSLLRRHQT